MAMLDFWAVAFLFLGLMFALGFFPALLVFGGRAALAPGEGRSHQLALVAAPVVGTLLFHFLAYAISSGFGVGLSKLAWPVLLALLAIQVVALLVLGRQNHSRLVQITLEHKKLLALIAFVVLPISGFHIIQPMYSGHWSTAYSTGNDGARYLMMIDYLQDHYWVYGANVEGPIKYALGNRPLMHYIQAMPTALFGIPSYLSYPLTAVMASFMSTLALACLGGTLLRARMVSALIVCMVVFGFYGFYLSLYYTGFLGQYFSLFPILLALTAAHWKVRLTYLPFVQALILAFVTASYSVGFAIVVAAMIALFYVLQSFYGSVDKRALAIRAVSLLMALVAVLAIFNYELAAGRPGDFLAARNAGYDYGLLKSMLIMGGMAQKWTQFEAIEASKQWLLVAPLLYLWLFSLWVSWRMRREAAEYLLLVYGITVVMVSAYVTGNYYLLNKTSVLVIPIMVLALTARLPGRAQFGIRGAGFISWVAIAVVGSQLLGGFYVEVSKARHTNIDASLIGAEGFLKQGKYRRVYSVDFSLERHLLERQFFKEAAWQPIQDKMVWPEMGVMPSDSAAYSKYDFDLVFIAKDAEGPARLVDGNAKWELYDGGWFGLYSPEVNLVEFDANWDWKGSMRDRSQPRRLRTGRESKNGGTIVFVKNHGCDEVAVRFAEPGMLKGLNLMVNSKPVMLDGHMERNEVIIPCGRHFTQRVNQVQLSSPTPLHIIELRF